MPCGASRSEGQKFVWNNETLSLAQGMFRSGECLGYVNNTSVSKETATHPLPAIRGVQFNLCTKTQDLFCNATRYRQVLAGYPNCKACLAAHADVLKQQGKCTPDQMGSYCGGPVGPAPRIGPHGEPNPPKGSGTMIMKSTDQVQRNNRRCSSLLFGFRG